MVIVTTIRASWLHNLIAPKAIIGKDKGMDIWFINGVNQSRLGEMYPHNPLFSWE
jgi:hypothetical protein